MVAGWLPTWLPILAKHGMVAGVIDLPQRGNMLRTFAATLGIGHRKPPPIEAQRSHAASIAGLLKDGTGRPEPAPGDGQRHPSDASRTADPIPPDDDPSLAIPTTESRPTRDHAAALLAWLQGPGGRTGRLRASELRQAHNEMCADLDWEPIGWTAVGRELRQLLGARKEYATIGGKKVRAYRIPPRSARRPPPVLRAVG